MTLTERRAEADFAVAVASLIRDQEAVNAARGFGPGMAGVVADALHDLFAETALKRLLDEERRYAEESVTAARVGEESAPRDLFGRRLAETAVAVAGRCYEGAAHAAGEAVGGGYEHRRRYAEMVRKSAGILLSILREGIDADVLTAERGRYLNRWKLAEYAGRPAAPVAGTATAGTVSPADDLHADCRYRTPVPRGDRDELHRRLMEQAERDPRFTVATEDGGEFSQRRWGDLVGAPGRTVGKDDFYKMTLAKVRPDKPPRPKRAAVSSDSAATTREEDDPLEQLIAAEAERDRQIAKLEAEQRGEMAADRAGRPDPV